MTTRATSRVRSVMAAALALSGVGLPARAVRAQQPLADVARKEEERRKGVTEPTKVYTNKDLKAVPSGSPVLPLPDKSTADAPKDTDDAKARAALKAGEPVKDQAYWFGKLKALQDQLTQDQSYAVAMQTRIDALTTDFVNRDDPAQRSRIEQDRVKAIADLDRLKKAIDTDTKAIADFQEEARRAGVPPGWLR